MSEKGTNQDSEKLVSEFSREIIGWSRDGSKEVRFGNCHILCSKMATYLEAIPSIRYSLATVYTRYTVHGRGAKLELLRNTDASMDPFQTWNQSKNMRMELRPSYVSAYARIRKIETTVIWHPFLPVKPHGHFLHFFFQKNHFFSSKKGVPEPANTIP